MADAKWYYAKNGQQQGPVDLATLQAMVQSGQVAATDLVWTEGMAEWSKAGSTPALFPQGTPAAVPSPYGTVPTPGSPGQAGTPIPMNYYRPTPQYATIYAGFWLRFCAAFLDGIITGVAGAMVGCFIGLIIGVGSVGSGANQQQTETLAGLAGNLLGIVVAWLYSAFMESSSTQATLGKMAVGIKVTDIEGNRISFARATGRHFAKFISAIILLIGYIMAAFTERKQALHDMMASTLVVRK